MSKFTTKSRKGGSRKSRKSHKSRKSRKSRKSQKRVGGGMLPWDKKFTATRKEKMMTVYDFTHNPPTDEGGKRIMILDYKNMNRFVQAMAKASILEKFKKIGIEPFTKDTVTNKPVPIFAVAKDVFNQDHWSNTNIVTFTFGNEDVLESVNIKGKDGFNKEIELEGNVNLANIYQMMKKDYEDNNLLSNVVQV
jgi:hypothetical protein